MANYANLISDIHDAIKTNGTGAISGQATQTILDSMVGSLGSGFQYKGIATPSTDPGTPDERVFYIASTAGTYTNFGGLVLANGEIAILKYNGAWSKDSTGAASLELVNELPNTEDSGNDADLDIADPTGYVLARFKDGYFRTKNFNSAENNANIGIDNVPDFDETETYSVGDVVKYNGLLYKFIAEHSGAWDEADVEQTTIIEMSKSGGEHPVSVEDSGNDADLDIADPMGNVLMRLRGGHIKTKRFDSRFIERIKILFFGNSLSQDAVSYVPLLLKNICPTLNFDLYIWYNAGATLQQQYNNYLIGGQNCDIFSIYKSEDDSWTNYANSKNINWVINNCDFDILCLQEYSYYTFTDAQLKTNFENVVNWFFNNYSKSIKVVTMIDQPNRAKVESMYALAEHYSSYFLEETCAQSIIPAGSAIYYALQTSLSTLGDAGGLSPDGTHAQEGLPCVLQAYVVAMWIFEQCGIPQSIFGNKIRITNDIYQQLNVPGPNLGSGVITGTEEQNMIAQNCAIKALKRGKALEILTLINN